MAYFDRLAAAAVHADVGPVAGLGIDVFAPLPADLAARRRPASGAGAGAASAETLDAGGRDADRGGGAAQQPRAALGLLFATDQGAVPRGGRYGEPSHRNHRWSDSDRRLHRLPWNTGYF